MRQAAWNMKVPASVQLKWLLCGTIFFPLLPDYAGLALEYLLMVANILILAALSYVLSVKVGARSFGVFLVFVVLLLLSLVRSTDILVLEDFFELSKPLLFFLVFCVYLSVFRRYEIASDYTRFIYGVMIAICIFGVLESLLGGFNSFSSVVYKGGRQPVQYKAVIGFISPYTYASLVMLPIGISLFYCLMGYRKLISIVLFLLSLSALVLSQSRTVLLGFLFNCVVLLPLMLGVSWLPNKRYFKALCVGVLAVLVVGLPFFWSYAEDNLRYIYSGISVVIENFDLSDYEKLIYSTPSISNRYEQFVNVWEYQDIVPLFGVAIGKAQFWPESFYALYLLRVGVIGVVIHFGVITAAAVASWRLARFYASADVRMTGFFLGCFYYMCSLPISYFSSAVNDQVRSGMLFYILLALIFSIYSKCFIGGGGMKGRKI